MPNIYNEQSNTPEYYSHGVAFVVYTEDGLKIGKRDHLGGMQRHIICGDIMSGKDFYEDVDCGGIIDYDGCIGEVYIDGYVSNLGLHHRGLLQGGFPVDGPTWLGLCKDHDIEVEWCNK